MHRARPTEPASVDLSVVIVVYDMIPEAARTLQSLTPQYQVGVDFDYEVVVVDNGSPQPMDPNEVAALGPGFKYIYLEDAGPSPAAALNLGVSHTSGQFVGLIVDGARIASPGLLHHAWTALRAVDTPVVTSLSWHLGPAVHREAVARLGHTKQAEEALLDDIRWRENGYRLFEISVLSGSSRRGWLLPKEESSSLFMSRQLFDRLGGLDERFTEPGGGLVNYDFYWRACNARGATLCVLLGEGTFHQMHGGAMTGADAPEARALSQAWSAEYRRLTGREPGPVGNDPLLIGRLRPPALRWMVESANSAVEALGENPTPETD